MNYISGIIKLPTVLAVHRLALCLLFSLISVNCFRSTLTGIQLYCFAVYWLEFCRIFGILNMFDTQLTEKIVCVKLSILPRTVLDQTEYCPGQRLQSTVQYYSGRQTERSQIQRRDIHCDRRAKFLVLNLLIHIWELFRKLLTKLNYFIWWPTGWWLDDCVKWYYDQWDCRTINDIIGWPQ